MQNFDKYFEEQTEVYLEKLFEDKDPLEIGLLRESIIKIIKSSLDSPELLQKRLIFYSNEHSHNKETLVFVHVFCMLILQKLVVNIEKSELVRKKIQLLQNSYYENLYNVRNEESILLIHNFLSFIFDINKIFDQILHLNKNDKIKFIKLANLKLEQMKLIFPESIKKEVEEAMLYWELEIKQINFRANDNEEDTFTKTEKSKNKEYISIKKPTSVELSVEELKEIFREELQKTGILQPVQQNAEKRFLSLSELIEYTHLPKTTIYSYTHRNMIPHLKKAKRLFFEKDKIDKWLEEGRKKTIKEIEIETNAFLDQKRRK